MPLCMDLKKEFDIKAINALHYFEYKSNFIFQSDYHDDWRLFYVEQGACEISFSNTGKEPVIVETHGIFIEAPEEYYSFKSARADSCFTAPISPSRRISGRIGCCCISVQPIKSQMFM